MATSSISQNLANCLSKFVKWQVAEVGEICDGTLPAITQTWFFANVGLGPSWDKLI